MGCEPITIGKFATLVMINTDLAGNERCVDMQAMSILACFKIFYNPLSLSPSTRPTCYQ